jgi:hypothetical protein
MGVLHCLVKSESGNRRCHCILGRSELCLFFLLKRKHIYIVPEGRSIYISGERGEVYIYQRGEVYKYIYIYKYTSPLGNNSINNLINYRFLVRCLNAFE